MIATQFSRQRLESVLSPCDKDELRACVGQRTRGGCAYTGCSACAARDFIRQCCHFCILSSCSADLTADEITPASSRVCPCFPRAIHRQPPLGRSLYLLL